MKKIPTYLTYAGAIPFIFCAVFLGLDIQKFPFLGSVEKILSVYGLVILSFLAGAHWGQHLHMKTGFWCGSLPIFSNVIAVFLWLGFLVFSFEILISIFVVSLILLLLIDYFLFKMDVIKHHYLQTRFFVSAIVIISLIISGMLS